MEQKLDRLEEENRLDEEKRLAELEAEKQKKDGDFKKL
jgi:hypothetical protein